MILCLAPNPAVDRNLMLSSWRRGRVNRAEEVLLLPAGKGHNVARVLGLLGEEVELVGLLAGHSGRWIAERLPGRYVWLEGETRHCHILVAEGEVTVLNELGPRVTPPAWEAFLQAAGEAARRARAVVLSGSLPPGADPSALAGLVAASPAPVFLDTHGESLREGLRGRPHAVKLNAREAEEQLGSSDPRALLQAGARLGVVTLGARGALAASEEEAWRVLPPRVRVVSAVGSGDAFLAGLVAGHVRGLAVPAALRLAAAAGAANAMELGAGRLEPAQVERLQARVRLEALG